MSQGYHQPNINLAPDLGAGQIQFSAPTVQGLELLTSNGDGVAVGSLGVVSATGNVYRALTAGVGGSTWAPASGERDIRDYGADTSLADNAAAILAALNAGGVIVVPPGLFDILSRVDFFVAGTTLRGRGKNSIIRLAANVQVLGVRANNCAIENLTVRGSGNFAHTVQSLIRIVGDISDLRVENTWLEDSGFEAVDSTGTSSSVDGCRLIGNQVTGCQRGFEFIDAGVATSGSKNLQILSNTFRRGPGSPQTITGIAISHETTDAKIEGNDIEAWGFPIAVASAQRVQIIGNECWGAQDAVSRGEGIHIESSDIPSGTLAEDILVQGNIVHDCVSSGIVATGNDVANPSIQAEKIQIQNNVVFDCDSGIFCEDIWGLQVQGNRCYSNQNHGIFVVPGNDSGSGVIGCRDVKVDGNLCADNNEGAVGGVGIRIGIGQDLVGVRRYSCTNNTCVSGVGLGTGVQAFGILINSLEDQAELRGNVMHGNAAEGFGGTGAIPSTVTTYTLTTVGAGNTDFAPALALPTAGDIGRVRVVFIGTQRGGAGRAMTTLERITENTGGVLANLSSPTNVTARSGGFATAAGAAPISGTNLMLRVTGEGAGITVDWTVQVWTHYARDRTNP